MSEEILIKALGRWVGEAKQLADMLSEARRQIEYLHEKFQPTGTGEAMLARIDESLRAARGEQ